MVHLASYSMAPDEAMACRAAVVTETTVNPQADPTVGLFVMAPTGGHVVRGVSCDLGSPGIPDGYPAAQLCDGLYHLAGTWHWPGRV